MSVILNIDSAISSASVCISKNSEILSFEAITTQKEQASLLQTAIQKACAAANISLSSLDAVAITFGPGSYTGLRVGMATAKGICYALNKQLITINTLEVMASAALSSGEYIHNHEETVLVPMIDARRMEVFTAVYSVDLQPLTGTAAIEIDQNSFSDWLKKGRVLFFGDGSEKFKNLMVHPNASFCNVQYSAKNVATLAAKYQFDKTYANLAYSEPFYAKSFHLLHKQLNSS